MVTKACLPPADGGPDAALAPGPARPGELIRLVAEGLTANGFHVRMPERATAADLAIDWPTARCTLSVSDCGDVEWDCWPQSGGATDPKQVADLATVLLTGQAQDHPRRGNGYGLPGITFKGIVGLELKARGFDVSLEVLEDQSFFDAYVMIVVTSPGSAQRAAVHVADDGSVAWMRDYWPESAPPVTEPDFWDWIADPQKVAAAVVTTITRAMSQASLATS